MLSISDYLSVCFCFSLSCAMFGQELKEKSSYSNGVIEEYQVIKDQKKVKHGSYVKYFSLGGRTALLEHGAYRHNQKHGLWHYYFPTYQGWGSIDGRVIPAYSFREKSANKLMAKGNYINGNRHGLWQFFYLDTFASQLVRLEHDGKEPSPGRAYEVIPNEGQAYLLGQFKKGQRVGIWVTFSKDGDVTQSYDFGLEGIPKDSLLMHTMDTSTVDHHAMFLGGAEVFDYLFGTLQAWRESELYLSTEDSTTVPLIFHIDGEGNCIQWEI